MKRFGGALVLAGAMSIFGLSSVASASPIGTISFANCNGGGVTVTATTITWSPNGTSSGTGCIQTGIGTSVTWSGGTLLAGVTGDIMNLTIGGGTVDHFIDLPAATTPSLDFTLDGFTGGTSNTNCAGATTAGSTCSVVANSPFLLTYLGSNLTTISLAAHGTVADSNGSSNWAGSFSTQYLGTPLQIQNTFLSQQSFGSTYSASFAMSTVPEPVSTALIGSGLVALALIRRKKSRA